MPIADVSIVDAISHTGISLQNCIKNQDQNKPNHQPWHPRPFVLLVMHQLSLPL
jgi:hypothetical protein